MASSFSHVSKEGRRNAVNPRLCFWRVAEAPTRVWLTKVDKYPSFGCYYPILSMYSLSYRAYVGLQTMRDSVAIGFPIANWQVWRNFRKHLYPHVLG